MAKFVGAALLDTRSIQKYVFASNELKTNVGASFIVDQIFKNLMCEKILPGLENKLGKVDLDWSQNGPIRMLSDINLNCEIAYIGGGNMLIMVRKQGVIEDSKVNAEASLDMAKAIVREWTKALLVYAPGLKTGAAIGIVDLEAESYRDMIKDLYNKLKDNQNNIIPNVDIPYTGFTKECDVSGKTACAYDYSKGKSRMVSAEVKSKIDAYKYAERAIKDNYYDIIGDNFDFVSEFEKMGYKEGESYLSVIHIDGNNMGVRFSSCKTMQERKNLSKNVAIAVDNSFRKLLKSIIEEHESYGRYLEKSFLSKDDKIVLPIRPIIIGGDDITFVCPGRLGIEYAKRFLEFISKEKISENGDTLECCAGVAVVPARYPFFRAYDLAEQVCGEAKKKSRHDNNKCWMDFVILHGEMSPELDQLRRQQYSAPEGNLHFGPYKVEEEYKGLDGIEALLRLEKALDENKIEKNRYNVAQKKAAHNKVKKLRDVLNQDMHAQERFLDLADEIKKVIATEKGKNQSDVKAADFWEKNGATRYIDAIEIMDFIPV